MLNLVRRHVLYWYHQYELITCVNMFEPWEQVLLHSTTIIILSLVSYSSYVYLPSYMLSLWKRCSAALSTNET